MSLIHQLLLFCVVIARCSIAEVADDSPAHPPRIHSPSMIKNVTRGADIKFICGIDFQPGSSLALFWKKGSDMLSVNDNVLDKKRKKPYKVFNEGLEIEIVDVQREDDGEYTCSVTSNPQVNQSHYLTVYHLSSIDLNPSPVKDIQQGQQLVLACTGEGNPIPKATWKFNGRAPGEHVRARHHTGELIIDSVSLDDAGLYECTLFNKAGQLTKAVGVNVFVSPVVQINPPNGNASVKQGDSVTISCQVNARGNILPSWYFENKSMHHQENELTISNANKKNQGKYECRFATDIYATISGKFFVTVLHPDGDGNYQTASLEHATTTKPAGDTASSNRRLQLISILTAIILSIFFW